MSLKFAMPLLSTLAAMVILVHSAEEMDNYNSREMRARSLDRDTDGDMEAYEQPWRTVDDTGLQHTTPIYAWREPGEDPPRRRRLGRKRKRRPQYVPTEDEDSRERYMYHEEQLKPHSDFVDKAEKTIRRRRLPVDWSDEADDHRRQRGLRRRPKYPAAREKYHRGKFEENPQEEKEEFTNVASAEEPMVLQSDDKNADAQHAEPEVELIEEPDENEHKTNLRPVLNTFTETTTKDTLSLKHEKEDDHSLSEFSSEVYTPILRPRMTYSLKDLEPYTPKEKTDLDRAQGNPSKPLSLKEILKRSKGKSLSEILQQRNFTLSDLLQGKINALSLLKADRPSKVTNNNEELNEYNVQPPKSEVKEKPLNEETYVERDKSLDLQTENETPTTTPFTTIISDLGSNNLLLRNARTNITNVGTRIPLISTKRHFQPGIRRKLRMKPSINSLSKTDLSREIVALAGRPYLHRPHKNVTKLSEWKDIIPKMINRTADLEEPEEMKVDFPPVESDTTKLVEEIQTTTQSPVTEDFFAPTETDGKEMTTETATETEQSETDPPTTTFSTTTVISTTTELTTPTTTTSTTTASPRTRATEKPIISPNRAINNGTALRWQAFNNRMKKKRMRQKNLSETQKNISNFATGDLKPASEFVAKTQAPGMATTDKVTEEFITTELLNGQESGVRKARLSTALVKPTTSKTIVQKSTTEKTAKFEIEEILKDTRTSSTLSKILIDRNMTLSELFDHRERGSSHLHLADIFHNASKEPSAPEPFLSKSLIEPISKETYPLRAILEANQHDPAVKTTTTSSLTTTQNHYTSVPIVLDFGNNVNENAENMGIMALFNNLTTSDDIIEEDRDIKTDSQGSIYKTSVLLADVNDTNRLGRDYKFRGESTRWGDMLTMLKKAVPNRTKPSENDISKDSSTSSETFRKPNVEEVDGEGLIILEDLQRLDSKISSILNETRDISTDSVTESDESIGILNKPHVTAKSVTVATAGIIGLAMVLFLLTYALFKWNQQRIILRNKQNFSEDRIPTPVFEKRKSAKLNNSSRSISPMLSCNIYTMDTLDSSNGKDSPEYMWDNLRKPFQ